MIAGYIVSVGTEPTEISYPEAIDSVPGQSIGIQNQSGATIYLGDENVTTSVYGWKLANNGELGIDLNHGEKLYAVVVSSTANVNVLITGAK